MARNAIYVGGKEIIRRYVGNKIVWRKSYYAQEFSGRYYVKTQDHSGLKMEFRVYGASYASYIKTIGDGRLELEGNIAFFSKLEADIYTNSYNNETYNRLIITFLNQSDKNKFLWKIFSSADIKIFKKAYK